MMLEKCRLLRKNKEKLKIKELKATYDERKYVIWKQIKVIAERRKKQGKVIKISYRKLVGARRNMRWQLR